MTKPKQLELRHISVRDIYQHFKFEHLPSDLSDISRECHDLAVKMIDNLDDGPELTAGLRRLLEAKDCFVRQAVVDRD